MDTFATIFQYIFWGGAVAFGIAVLWKMISGMFE